MSGPESRRLSRLSRRRALAALAALVPLAVAPPIGAGASAPAGVTGRTSRPRQTAAGPLPFTCWLQGSADGPLASLALTPSAGIGAATARVQHPDGSTEELALTADQPVQRHIKVRMGSGAWSTQTASLALVWRDAAGAEQTARTRPLSLGGLAGSSVRKTWLPSGLLVLTVERPDAPTVAINVAANAGMRDEDARSLGAAHWLEHAFFLGSTDHPDPGYFSRLFDGLGGETNGWTWIEQTHYYVAVPKHKLEPALAGLAEMVTVPAFNRGAVDRERRVVAREAALRLNTPTTAVIDAIYPLIFQQHPAKNAGAKEVPDVAIDTMIDFRDQHYLSGNLVVGVVGAVTHDEAVPLVEARFAALPFGPRLERQRVSEPKLTEIRRVERGNGRSQAQVAIGWPMIGLDSPDRYTAWVLDAIMDQPGRRLSRALRTDREIATSAGTVIELFSDAGYWLARAQTSPDRTDAVTDAILDEIRRLQREGPTDAEVRDAVSYVQGGKLLAWERPRDQADHMTEGEVIGALESVDDLLAGLAAVTPAAVQRFAQTQFDPDRYAIAIVRY